jgi:hypothetical protein
MLLQIAPNGPHPGGKRCSFLYRDSADSAIKVIDEGIILMKTHRQTLHVAKHARTAPADGVTEAQRTDPLVRTARRILILALVLGSIGAEAAASSGFAGTDHTSANQPTNHVQLTSAATMSVHSPWMY